MVVVVVVFVGGSDWSDVEDDIGGVDGCWALWRRLLLVGDRSASGRLTPSTSVAVLTDRCRDSLDQGGNLKMVVFVVVLV